MRNIKYIRSTAVAVAAVFAGVGAARADAVNYTVAVAPTASPEDFIVPISQFNPALGTLTAVDISVSEVTVGYMYLENTDSLGIYGMGYGHGGIEASIPTVDDISAASGWNGAFTYLAPFDGLADFSGPDSLYASGSNSMTSADHFTDPTFLNNLIGSGFFFGEIIVGQYTGLDRVEGANLLFYNTASGDLSLTYTYTPAAGVPEPATWAMMLFGAGAIGGAMRIRRRNLGRIAVN